MDQFLLVKGREGGEGGSTEERGLSSKGSPKIKKRRANWFFNLDLIWGRGDGGHVRRSKKKLAGPNELSSHLRGGKKAMRIRLTKNTSNLEGERPYYGTLHLAEKVSEGHQGYKRLWGGRVQAAQSVLSEMQHCPKGDRGSF